MPTLLPPIRSLVSTPPIISSSLVTAFCLFCFASLALADEGELRSFDRFLGQAAPICLSQSAIACVNKAWGYGDRDRDGKLSIAEVNRNRRLLSRWVARRHHRLAEQDRQSILLGLMLVESVGLERLFAGFDSDRDGHLSRAELLADVALDERPLGQILSDPKAVDWSAIRNRLGGMGSLLDGVTIKPEP